MDKIRGFRPPYVWMKTFVFFRSLTVTTNALFFVRLLREPDSALYSAENLQKLAETSLKWITRVPATLTEAQAVLAQAPPATRPGGSA